MVCTISYTEVEVGAVKSIEAPVIHYWPFQCGSSDVVLCYMLLVSELWCCFTLCLFIKPLVRSGLVSGHLLGKSCPLGWSCVITVFCQFVISYFPFWFWEFDLVFDWPSSCTLLSYYFLYMCTSNWGILDDPMASDHRVDALGVGPNYFMHKHTPNIEWVWYAVWPNCIYGIVTYLYGSMIMSISHHGNTPVFLYPLAPHFHLVFSPISNGLWFCIHFHDHVILWKLCIKLDFELNLGHCNT